jgi:hypothetical protein
MQQVNDNENKSLFYLSVSKCFIEKEGEITIQRVKKGVKP